MNLRRLFPLTLLLSLLLGLALVPAHAQDGDEEQEFNGTEHYVEVRDDGYLPAQLTIEPGDRVFWVWTQEGPHSVTATPDATNDRAFDSHPDCPDLLGGSCGTNGDIYPSPPGVFDQPGNFRYSSRHPDDAETHDGAISVLAPAPTTSPTPSESTAEPSEEPSNEPSEEPSNEPTEEPTDEPTDEPTGEGTETAAPTGTPTETETPTATPTPQRGNAPNFSQNSRPVPPPNPIEEPVVAGSTRASPAPEATFEDFPAAAADPGATVTPSADDENLGAVVLPDDGDGPSGRMIWGLFGGGLLAATTGAFGKIVLFGQTWA